MSADVLHLLTRIKPSNKCDPQVRFGKMRKRFRIFCLLATLVYTLHFSWYVIQNLRTKSTVFHCSDRFVDEIFRRDSKVLVEPQWPNCCTPVFLVIVVLSAPSNLERRSAIRSSWASMLPNRYADIQNLGEQLYSGTNLVKTVFLVGRAKKAALRSSVETESNYYGDMVIGSSIVDSYDNLTLKTKLGLAWAYVKCKFEYLMKTDDDSFVNTKGLVKWLWNSPKKGLYTGNCQLKPKVIQLKDHKWYISKDIYKNDVYPPFCHGKGYILSSDVVQRIVSFMERQPLFPLEDVFVGMLVHKLKIMPVDHRRLFQYPVRNFSGDLCDYKDVFLVHKVSVIKMLKLHLRLLNPEACA